MKLLCLLLSVTLADELDFLLENKVNDFDVEEPREDLTFRLDEDDDVIQTIDD